MVWVETPTNPLLSHRRHRAVAAFAARAGTPLVRRRQHLRHARPAAAPRPRRRRRRALHHQVPRRPQRRGRRLRRHQRRRRWPSGSASSRTRSGAVPGPLDCYLVLRGLKTLAVRMDRHCENAAAVAEPAGRAPGRRPGALARPRSTTPATTSPPARCATSAAWSRSRWPAARQAALDVVARTELFTLAESPRRGRVASSSTRPA